MIYTVSKKILIYFLLSAFNFGLSTVFATEVDKGDCGFVEGSIGGNFGIMFESRSGQNEIIYPKESIKRALLNLKAYCCNEGDIIGKENPSCKSDSDAGLFPSKYPQSKFLYDHLVDIGFRRLDAMEKLLYKGVTPDPVGKERRDFINKKGSQEQGTTPTDIMPKFSEQWTKNINYILPYREDGNYNKQYQDSRISITKDYNSRPLVNRYSNMCEIAAYIYGYFPSLELGDHTKTYGYSSCLLLSRNIISRNVVFTKSIVLKKSNKLLYDNINTHITNYLSQTRLTKLKETILSIVQAFNVINKKVVKLIEKCS